MLYEQIFELLSQQIQTGEISAGVSLPNEYQLSQDFGVSVGTLRKAIELLVKEGIVERRRSKGTFVVDRRFNATSRFYEAIRNSDGSFVDWRYVRHHLTFRNSSPDEASRFGLLPGSRLGSIKRVRAIGFRSAMVATTLVPADRFRDFSDLTSPAPIIVSLAEAAGIKLGSTEEAVDVCQASIEAAKEFKVERSCPIIRLKRIVRDRDHVPVEISCAEFHLQGEQYRAPISGSRHGDLRMTGYFP